MIAGEVGNGDRDSDATILDALSDRLLSAWSRDMLQDALFEFIVPAFAAGAMLRTPAGDPRAASVRSRGTLEGERRRFALHRREWRAELDVFDASDRPALHVGIERASEALARVFEFQREHRVALTFQEHALATELPQSELYEMDAVYSAGRTEALVGGDWYDAFALPDGRLVLSIGDVVGSGLSAAVTMLSIRQAIRGVACVHPHPETILTAANLTLRSRTHDSFVTAFVAVVDPITGYCVYSGAGHPPALVRDRDGAVRGLHSMSLPLGITDRDSFRCSRTKLDEGSVLLLYTDGIVESERNIIDGEARLREVFAMMDAQQPEVARRLYEQLLPSHARDDVAMLALRLRKMGRVLRWRFDPVWDDASRRVRREIAAALGEDDFAHDDIVLFEMLFSELISNALRHAPGTIEAYYERRADGVVVHVIDDGPGFEYRPRLPHDVFSEGGRGLFFLSKLSTDFNVETNGRSGSHARLVLRPRAKELCR